MKRLVLCIQLLLAGALSCASPPGHAARVLVPAYSNPCCGGGPTMWTAVNAFAAAQPTQIGVVLNPASGPGASPIDPNYIDATGHGPLVDLIATGAPVYGYVATTNGSKPIATAQAEIALYYDNNYWRGQSIHLFSAFFLFLFIQETHFFVK